MSSALRISALVRPAAAAVALSALLSVTATTQQIPAADPDGPGPKVGLAIAVTVGSARYDFTGKGVCLKVADGSIYDAPAVMYSVRQTGDRQRFNVTLYRLKSGSDMMTLDVTVGAATHSVSTVKVGANGVAVGSGTTRLQTAGKGGTLTIDAVAAGAVTIAGTVRCEAFTTPVESNGH